MVVNGNKGLASTGGAVMELSKERVEELRESGYLSLGRHPGAAQEGQHFQLSPLPETKVQDQPAVGVKVSRKDHADVNLYFDKSSRAAPEAGTQGHARRA